MTLRQRIGRGQFEGIFLEHGLWLKGPGFADRALGKVQHGDGHAVGPSQVFVRGLVRATLLFELCLVSSNPRLEGVVIEFGRGALGFVEGKKCLQGPSRSFCRHRDSELRHGPSFGVRHRVADARHSLRQDQGLFVAPRCPQHGVQVGHFVEDFGLVGRPRGTQVGPVRQGVEGSAHHDAGLQGQSLGAWRIKGIGQGQHLRPVALHEMQFGERKLHLCLRFDSRAQGQFFGEQFECVLGLSCERHEGCHFEAKSRSGGCRACAKGIGCLGQVAFGFGDVACVPLNGSHARVGVCLLAAVDGGREQLSVHGQGLDHLPSGTQTVRLVNQPMSFPWLGT